MAAAGIRPHAVTAVGFLAGVAAAARTMVEAYRVALALILLNRLADGLDGTVARHGRPTDLCG